MHGWFGTDHRGMEGLELGESRWSGKLFILNKQTNKKTREWPKQTFDQSQMFWNLHSPLKKCLDLLGLYGVKWP